MDVSAKLGGHKDGANSANITRSIFPPQYFIGMPIRRSALFKFDLVPPVHCLSNPNNDCHIFAIYLEQDITKVCYANVWLIISFLPAIKAR